MLSLIDNRSGSRDCEKLALAGSVNADDWYQWFSTQYSVCICLFGFDFFKQLLSKTLTGRKDTLVPVICIRRPRAEPVGGEH